MLNPSRNLKNTRFGDWSCGSFHCFLIFYCIVTSIQRLPGPFMGALLQSVERQFQISSRVSGTLLSAGDIGHISAVVILAYLGSRGNRVRWLGGGGLLIAFASLVISMPGYVFPQKDGLDYHTLQHQSYNVSFAGSHMHGPIDPTLLADAKLPFGYCNNDTIRLKDRLHKAKCQMHNGNVGNTMAYYILLTGIVLLGIGKSMPHTLGVPLIDDGVKDKRKTPIYFAAISCLRIFGPVLGMVLSAVCSGLYVNFKPPPGMTPYDPRWIGAWWLGFVLVTCLLVGPTLGLMFYPNVDEIIKNRQEEAKNRRRKKTVSGEQEHDDAKIPLQEKDAKTQKKGNETSMVTRAGACLQVLGFLTAIIEILKSPIYTGRLVGRLFDAFAYKGMAAFRSKYLENHFGIPMYKANISIGFLGIGSYMSGVLLGTFIMRRFNLDGRRAAAYVAFCSIMATILTLCQSFLSCHAVVNQIGRDGAVHNYTYPPCLGCDCTAAPLYPVCSVDGTPFYSPCHAGCKDYDRTIFNASTPIPRTKKGSGISKFIFQSCSCVDSNKTDGDQRVSRDWCIDDCFRPMILYFMLSSIGAIIAGTGQIPGMLIGLRSVPREHRSVALGFSSLVVGLISVLPSTPIYGMIIDAACVLWNKSCNGDRGACLIYDPNRLRRGIITMYVILHAIGDLSDIFVWYKAKNMKLMPDEKDGHADGQKMDLAVNTPEA